jgi:hypothetical protein
VAINPEGTSLRGNKSEIGKRSPVATNPEGHAFTRANKRHAEGVTALPKARLYALAVVRSLQSGLKNPIALFETQPAT